MFLNDYIFATLPGNVDSYVWIFNLEGFGYSHFYLEAMKDVINTIQKVLVTTNHKFVCANPNFVTRMVWQTLQPFLNERIKQKVVFVPDFSEAALAEVGVYLQSRPREWGGGPNAFSIEEGQ